MRQKINRFFEGLVNIVIFLPHFFSVHALLSSLIEPWKNLVEKDWVFNLISRAIGFTLRISLLIAFLFCMIAFFIFSPLIVLCFFITLPFTMIGEKFGPTDEQLKQLYKKEFISKHQLKPENLKVVEEWFEMIYQRDLHKEPWWKLNQLLAIPPLGRDWTAGYTPYLDKYSEDFYTTSNTHLSEELIGRDKEIKQIEQILSQRDDANILLVGEDGVGKDSLLRELTNRIYDGKTTTLLNYKRVLEFDMEKILNEQSDQKQREYFFEQLMEEASKAKNIIALIEHIDKYLHTSDERIDLSIPLEKYAQKNTLQFICTTTPYNFEKYIRQKESLLGFFTIIEVAQLPKDISLEIILSLIPTFESRYKVIVPYEICVELVDKSDYYITDEPLPEKAIRLLDAIGAYANQTKQKIITSKIIDQVLQEKTHVPTELDETTKAKLVNFESLLQKTVIGQDEAMHVLSSALRRAFVLLGKRKKPLASFLFLGPTGTGKTETAKTLALALFDSKDHLIRFDMSNFQTKEDIQHLIGSPEQTEQGLLTQAVHEHPYAVLLLDELEKAYPDLLNIFLTILDEGYFTDGFGKRVDCKNLVIIATSNVGDDYKNHFAPEFINRFDGIVVYKSLANDTIFSIAKNIVNDIAQKYRESHKISIEVSDDLLQQLVQKSYHPEYGARDMQRLIGQEIEDKVAKLILENKVQPGEIIKLTVL